MAHGSTILVEIEEKYAFSPFPSMDAVELVYGSILLSEKEASGHITFLSNDTPRLREIRSDVKYIYGVMRRKFKPSGITLEGDVKTEGSRVQFDFRVPDYINAVIKQLNVKRGESE